jgi:hypothetical protein
VEEDTENDLRDLKRKRWRQKANNKEERAYVISLNRAKFLRAGKT